MSTETDLPPRPNNYRPGTGEDRYERFCRDWLNLQVTYPQKEILEALEQHRRVVVPTANGIGKSYIVGGGGLAALYCNANCTVNVTSGSYGQMDDTIWKPIKSLHRQSELPGRALDNTRELRTELDEEWFLRCLSPRHPSELEGRHNERMIYLVEEADKPGITHEHIDSVESTITDSEDRVLVVANPPEDETNVVHDLIESEKWHTLQFASWDSHNLRVERGIDDAEKIGGLINLSEIQENWTDWNSEEWPGLEQVIEWSTPESPDFREDLDSRWYRRRAGVMPPQGAEKWRPWGVGDVEAAYQRDVGYVRETPEALGVDVADKTDTTKAIGLHGQKAVVEYSSQASLPQQERELSDLVREWPELDGHTDAIGRGAQLAQSLKERFGFKEFGNNEVAADDDYRDKWAHGLQLIGEWLRDGGSFEDKRLYEQLKIGARTLEFERTHLRSRGKVIEASSKEVLKDRLGYSPDELDALLMCCYAKMTEESDGKASPTFSW